MANEPASVGSSNAGALPSSMRDSAASVSASESASEYDDNEEEDEEDAWSSSSSGDEDDSEPDTGRAASGRACVRGSRQRY